MANQPPPTSSELLRMLTELQQANQHSISHFQELAKIFEDQFAASSIYLHDSNYLNTIKQGQNESLKDYITRFMKVAITIPDLYPKKMKLSNNILQTSTGNLVGFSGERVPVLESVWLQTTPRQSHCNYSHRLSRSMTMLQYQFEITSLKSSYRSTSQLNGIPVAIGIMDFQFMGGSMGSVVGEKITRLVEHAGNQLLPLILVCASGGARMQEGSLSLMQMAKISSALYEYQKKKRLFYVSILTSPTTGGVTASFGMLGDIIIAEPDAYIAFAGKRVIEQTLNTTIPEGSQVAEYLFQKGLFDSIVPRNPLKGVLSELFQLHAFFPL
ncbi:acetyl-coenzyme A carboxylase carboxyl transferase subunit beta, chloroplastic [Arachis hypogaea]|uniref:acetyl-coenzyme A carboxylase carboxyl transferase subunit beta, chloroplastic n=1 Tax=Arachis hypogaea TaxID=3818 RepID=UPI000DEC73A9|nr:uncharacterized protein LOC112699532 [Arachis hypogaea]